jgi:VanZ family protein
MSPVRKRSLVPWLLLAVIALIAYGSLYPFNFKPDAIDGGLLSALRELSWARAGRGDRISNVLLYLPLGFCLLLWLNARLHQGLAFALATLIGSLLSLCIEVAQVYTSSRVPSLTDLMLNAFGTSLGAIIGMGWDAIAGWMHLPKRAEKPARDPSAALLLFLWLTWRFAPFVPHFDLVKLKSALQPLFRPHIVFSEVLIYLTYWLVVSRAVTALVSRQRALEALLLLIAGVLVGRLTVANQAFVPSELLALLLLLPMVLVMHWLTPAPRRLILVGAIIGVFLFVRLTPFDFAASPAAFDFWPFLHWFDAGAPDAWWLIDWPEFFGTLFLFAAVMWVVRHSGLSFNIAVGTLMVLVFITEMMQLWLPARTGSLTDPVLALSVVLAFRYVLQKSRREFRRRAISQRGRTL